MTHRPARRLPRHQGDAAWNALLPPPGAPSPLTDRITADFAVVGGGFAGLSAARRLVQVQPGARIVLLEAGRIAEGAAGRNSGFMIDLPHDLTREDYTGAQDGRAVTALNRQAIAFAGDAVAEYAINPAFFDPAGKVNGAVGAAAHAHNLSYGRHLDQIGEAHDMLDAQDMAALTGSRRYRSGVYTPGTVMLQPAGYVRGLARRITIHENSPVTGLERTGPDWTVQTAAGAVTAPRVILATNGHLESFGFARGRLMHVFLYASMSPELGRETLTRLGGAPRWGVTPSDPMGTTMRRIDTAQGGNRLITRCHATLRSDMQSRPADLRRAATAQRAKFDARFPQLAGMVPQYEWAGHLCLTRNGVSVTQELEPGLFSATVQNGLGTARGTLTGIAAAELACGTSSEITDFFTTEDAPHRLPPRIVRDIGANAVLRWRQSKTGQE